MFKRYKFNGHWACAVLLLLHETGNTVVYEHCHWFHIILFWIIMVMVESSLLVDLYTAIHEGTDEVPSLNTHPFFFHEMSEGSHFQPWGEGKQADCN